MNDDQKDFLNFGIGALLLGAANIFAFYVSVQISYSGEASAYAASWIILWSLFVVDIMIILSIIKWSMVGNTHER